MSELRREALPKVLGPSGPELSCDECFDNLDVYVEREVAGVDPGIPGMAAHLEGCPACNEDHESLRAFVQLEHATAD